MDPKVKEELLEQLKDEAKEVGLDAVEDTVLKSWVLLSKYLTLYLASSTNPILKAVAGVIPLMDSTVRELIDGIDGKQG